MSVKETFYDWCKNNNREDLLDLWDYELNVKTPKEIGSGSPKKYYFKCPRGLHKSEEKYISIVKNQPTFYCNQCHSIGQITIDKYGEEYLWSKWSDKNIKSPFDISAHSSKTKIWLVCTDKDYHPDYEQVASVFANGCGCPYCSGKKLTPEDSFGGQHPELLHLWSDKNTISPFEISSGSDKKVYWKCENHKHEDYLRKMSNSNTYDFKCPICARENQKYNFIDLTAKTFGYLTVIGLDEEKTKNNPEHRYYWECKCRCGNEKSILGDHLRRGNIKSCGCLFMETVTNTPTWDWNVQSPSTERNRIRKSQEYIEWRDKVLDRDNHTCQHCGSKENLQAHHKNNFIDYPEQRLEVSNGITLCKSCHLSGHPNSFHSIYGTMGNTEQQFEEFQKTKTKEVTHGPY